MGNNIYPSNLPGMAFDGVRTPIWKTGVQEAMSGKQSTLAYAQYPLIKFQLNYDFLRDDYTPVNYCLWSSDFTKSNWTKSAGGTGVVPVVTANYAISPDGTFTADRIQFNRGSGTTSSDVSIIYQSTLQFLSLPSISSVWLKTNDGSTQTLILLVDSTHSVQINVTSTWQRFSFSTPSSNPATYLEIRMQGNIGTSSIADISAWGGQIESGLIATLYNPTTSFPTGGSEIRTLEGFFNSVQGQYDTFLYQDPKFNTVIAEPFGTGDGTTTAFQLVAKYANAGGYGYSELIQNLNGSPYIYRNDWQGNQLLYSTSRSNHVGYSENFANWSTFLTGVTLTANAGTGPDGGSTAGSLVYDGSSTSGQPRMFKTIDIGTSVSGQKYTSSIWIKSVSGTTTLSISNNIGGSTTCNLTTSWQRFSVVGTGDGVNLVQCRVGNVAGDNSAFSVLVFGGQIELGSVATAYIKTPSSTAVAYTDYTLGVTGIVTLTTAPLINAALTWTGSFYYRCRFTNDSYDFTELVNNWWTIAPIEFQSVKL